MMCINSLEHISYITGASKVQHQSIIAIFTTSSKIINLFSIISQDSLRMAPNKFNVPDFKIISLITEEESRILQLIGPEKRHLIDFALCKVICKNTHLNNAFCEIYSKKCNKIYNFVMNSCAFLLEDCSYLHDNLAKQGKRVKKLMI